MFCQWQLWTILFLLITCFLQISDTFELFSIINWFCAGNVRTMTSVQGLFLIFLHYFAIQTCGFFLILLILTHNFHQLTLCWQLIAFINSMAKFFLCFNVNEFIFLLGADTHSNDDSINVNVFLFLICIILW